VRLVMQTILGEHGNCMRACLASIFDVPIEECPDLSAEYDSGGNWWALLTEWCKTRDLSPRFEYTPCEPPKGYSMAGGASPRDIGRGHSCVALGGEIVHDPHPDGGGLSSIEDYIWFVNVGEKEQEATK